VTPPDDLDELAARAYQGLDELWIEDRVEAWIAPKIAGWCYGRVLDLGWGTGTMGRALLAAGVDLTVLEGSIDLAGRAVGAGAKVVRNLFETFEPDEPFDTVLCLFVLEHVEDPSVILVKAYSWLKPGGTLVVATPNASSVHRRVGAVMSGEPAETLSERDLLVGHRRVYTAADLYLDVAEAGFVAPIGFGWFLKPLNNARMIDWPAEIIDALCEVGWESELEDCANIGFTARKPYSPLDTENLS
jgi:SAM-dependent methyltransferase